METLKDIFVPYKIAVQLKEMGFECECIAYQRYDELEEGKNHLYPAVNYDLYNMLFETENHSNPNILPIPTYEQVFKWFREKNYQSNIVFNFGSFYGFIEDTRKIEAFATDEDYATYEQAREQLVLKLIEIYKDGKKDR